MWTVIVSMTYKIWQIRVSAARVVCLNWPAGVAPLWPERFHYLSKVFSTTIDPHPLIAIFCVRPENCRWQSNLHMYSVVAFTNLLAWSLILSNWKNSKPPSHIRWIKVLFYLSLEKIKFSLQGKKDKLKKVWMPFMTYFDKSNQHDGIGRFLNWIWTGSKYFSNDIKCIMMCKCGD